MYPRGQQQQQQQQVLFSLHSDLKRLSFPSSFGPLLSFSSIAIAFLVALVGFSWLSLIDFCSHFISLHLILVVFFLSHFNSFCFPLLLLSHIFVSCIFVEEGLALESRVSGDQSGCRFFSHILHTSFVVFFFLV
jgi:hypothetical protein